MFYYTDQTTTTNACRKTTCRCDARHNYCKKNGIKSHNKLNTVYRIFTTLFLVFITDCKCPRGPIALVWFFMVKTRQSSSAFCNGTYFTTKYANRIHYSGIFCFCQIMSTKKRNKVHNKPTLFIIVVQLWFWFLFLLKLHTLYQSKVRLHFTLIEDCTYSVPIIRTLSYRDKDWGFKSPLERFYTLLLCNG